MKTPLLVLAAAVLALSACKLFEDIGGGNSYDTYFEIPPGTNIPPDKQKELVDILSKYNNKLYWVWDVGKRSERGGLTCAFVHETLLEQVVKASSAGIPHSSIQIGIRRTESNCDQTHHTPVMQNTPRSHHTPFDHHTPNPHLTSQKDYDDSIALVKEVTPILAKYTHK